MPFKNLLRIEILRSKFILIWNELLRLSGANALNNPKFFYVVQSMILKLGVEMKNPINDIELTIEEPFIVFQNNTETTTEMNRITETYKKLLIFAKENEKDIIEMDDSLRFQILYLEDMMRDSGKILKEQNVPPIKKYVSSCCY